MFDLRRSRRTIVVITGAVICVIACVLEMRRRVKKINGSETSMQAIRQRHSASRGRYAPVNNEKAGADHHVSTRYHAADRS